MAGTTVTIYNQALLAIGETTLISGEEDDSLAAEICRLSYPECLRSILAQYEWPWAIQQDSLDAAVSEYDSTTTYAVDATIRYNGYVYTSRVASNLGNTPALDDTTYWNAQYPYAVGWGYVYSLPSDLVRPIAILLEGERVGTRTPESKNPFEIMQAHGGTGKILCCDVAPEDLYALEYVAFPESKEDGDLPRIYPPLFTDALTYFLASKLALSLVKNPALAGEMYKMYRVYLLEAITAELNARQKDVDVSPSSIRARED